MNYSQENNKRRMKRHKAHGKKVQNQVASMITRVIVASILIAGFAAVAAGFGFYFSVVSNAPDIENLPLGVMGGSLDSVLLDAFGNEIVRLDAGVNRTFAEWHEFPQHLIDAFVAIEDERFFEHNGVDARGMARAVWQTLARGRQQGGSTITQQLLKNLLGVTRNTVETKLQEQVIAVQFENILAEELGSKEAAKQQILHEYLNIIALGHGQHGVQAAARFYFNKDVSELTLSESAVIAAITQWPVAHSPVRFPDANRVRKVHVLDAMIRLGKITQAQFDEAYNDDVYDRISEFRDTIAPDAHIWSYFVDAVIERLIGDFMEMGMTERNASHLVYHGGLVIHTTMDPNIQAIVDAAYLDETLFPTNVQDFEYFLDLRVTVQNTTTGRRRNAQRTSNHYERRTTSKDEFDTFVQWALNDIMGMDDEIVGEHVLYYRPNPQSAMTVIDHNTGRVAAMAGQRGEKQYNRGFNRATMAARQPGSVFKIFAAYAPAIDMGMVTAATGVDDKPNVIFDPQLNRERVWPANHWVRDAFPYRGWTSVRRSIEMSYNVNAVHVWNTMRPQTVFNYLLNFGFSTLNSNESQNAAVVLGGLTHGVTNIDMTAAMGAIANGGILHQPILYTRVLDRHGTTIIDNRALEASQVLSRNSAYILVDMMRGVVSTSGTAWRGRWPGMDIMGKTGTTQNNRDLYFAASTPYYTAAVWVGHDRARDMSPRVNDGGRPDVNIWRHVMERIHEDLEERRFEQPPGFERHEVCGVSGLLPDYGCINDPRGSRVRRELFAPGTIPITRCNIHIVLDIEIATGLLPSQWTPSEQLERRVFIVARDREPWIDVGGDIPITDAWLEAPTTVSTLFNPFIESDYSTYNQYEPAPPEDDPVDPDNIYWPDLGSLPGGSGASVPVSAPGQGPVQSQPHNPSQTPEQPEQTPFPFVPAPIDRPPITWPEDRP